MLKTYIAYADSNDAKVNTDSGEDRGLVVATRNHKSYTTKTAFFTNATYGREMAQNGLYGGTALNINDGTDDAIDWTMVETGTIKWVEYSTDRFKAGTKSVLCDNAAVGSYAEFTNQVGGAGTDIDMSNYVAITMWITAGSDADVLVTQCAKPRGIVTLSSTPIV